MKLSNAARMFDTCPIYDAYTGALLFKAQPSSFVDNSTEGAVKFKRVMSAAPSVSMPAHKSLLALGTFFIVGSQDDDEFGGEAIRRNYWLKTVNESLKVLTPAQAVTDVPALSVYANRQLSRETADRDSANLEPQWSVYVPSSVSASPGMFLKGPTTLYRVRTATVDIDGFLRLLADELLEGRLAITVTTTGVYNPVTDTYGTASVPSFGIPLDVAKGYYTYNSQQKFEPADQLLVVSGSLSVAVGEEITVSGTSKFSGSWRVVSVTPELDGKLLQIRRR